MFEKLEQLRKMPDQKKRLVALGASFCITGVIFVFWIVSLSVTLSSGGQDASGGSAVATGAADVSPFSALEANVSAAFAPVGTAFENLGTYFSTTSTSTQISSSSQNIPANTTGSTNAADVTSN